MAEVALEGTVAGPGKRRLWTEMAVMAAVLWLPGVWTSVRYLQRHAVPSYAWPSELGGAISSLGEIALVFFILIRSAESLQRFGFSKPSLRLVGWAIALSAVVTLIGAAGGAWALADFLGVYYHGKYPPGRPMGHATLPIALLATVVPFRAFAEEVVFRAYCTTRLIDAWGSRAAAVTVGSLAFGVGHLYEGLTGALAASLVGVVYASVFLRTRSIWPSTVAHIAYNIFAFTGVPAPITLWLLRHMFGIS